ncbi:MAG: class I SAM-dependent methyltransferase [Campylobacterales bacterium]
MKVFDIYAQYYNLLYADKDYEVEVDYIFSLAQKFCQMPNSLLDIGCGTGKHAGLLQKKGISRVDGVDMSEGMLATAKINFPEIGFFQGDARNFRLNKQYDVITSLFHVASYQSGNDDLINYLKTAKEHLGKDGIFIFDCWYGPSVLSNKPAVRVKRLENESIKVVRLAEPTMQANDNTVIVNYELIITDKVSCKTTVINESHKMRYLFKPEIEYFMKEAGMELVGFEEWMTGVEPDFDSWTAVFVGRVI